MTTKEGKQILNLQGSVTIRDAQKLAAMVGGSLDENAPVEVDTSELTDIDTCILQYFCSLGKVVPELTFANPPGVLLSALDRSQLRRTLLGAPETL